MSPTVWHALEIELAPEAEEIINYALWELGCGGIETLRETGRLVALAAYFEAKPELENIRANLIITLKQAELPVGSLKNLMLREVPQEDWLKKWKEGYRAFPVGENFLIAPSWQQPNSQEIGERVLIELDPGMAFGTGTHETTQLCLLALEKFWRGGSLLDVGTGTGILAIAAAKLNSQAELHACDIDPQAVNIAEENARINNVSAIKFKVGAIAAYRGQKFSCVLANLTIDLLQPQLAALAAVVESNGLLIMSGLLLEQVEALARQLPAVGLTELARQTKGEWAMLAARPVFN